MSNCISELSPHSLQAWFSELAQQVTTLGVLLDASEEQQKQQGYYHTLHEICQQPLTWIHPKPHKIKGPSTVNPWLAAHRQLLFSSRRKEKGEVGENLGMPLRQ